jgi:UDP-2,4-diacetamido-2,4,6-trideoxy-beta-L-altropyranose hydrolase
MNIIFRVDSSTKMGAGHLMRCLALADEFKKQSHSITFICRALLGNLIELVEQKNHEVIVLPANKSFQSDNVYLDWLNATQEEDAEQTLEIIPKGTDLLIVDNYALDEIWHYQLRPFTKKIMVIDDLADRSFDCEILLNQNLGIQKKDYHNRVPKYCQLLMGCNYTLLRPEFEKLRNQAIEKRQNTTLIKNILISIGGSDTENLTLSILQGINDDFNVTVVLGGASSHNESIQDYAKDKNIKVIINASNMAELMLEADIAIGAGGSTSWERCCLGLPALLYITADNQRAIVENLERIGAVKIIKNFEQDLQAMINDFSCYSFMSKNASKVCDGLGIKRVVEYLQ